MLSATTHQLRRHLDPAALLPWIGIVAVGIVLGLCVLVPTWLATPWAVPFVALVLCPFLALIVGNPRTWLLAAIVLDTAMPVEVNPGYRIEAGMFGAIGGLNISLTTGCIVALY